LESTVFLMTYRWGPWAFEVPPGRDESVLSFLDQEDPPRWNLTVRSEPSSGSLEAWALAQKPPPGVEVVGRDRRQVAGQAAVLFEQRLLLEDRTPLTQWQAGIESTGQVIIVTMTTRPSAHGAAKEAFERLLSSWKREA
jgi:hypothetical protein